MARNTLFSNYLHELGVPHTESYSSSRFEAYPRKLALAGVEDLLDEYKVDSVRYRSGECRLSSLNVPFIAESKDQGYVIVTSVDENAGMIDYLANPRRRGRMTIKDFEAKWTGDALTANKTDASAEPDLREHRFRNASELFCKWGLVAIAIGLVAFWFVDNGIWRNWGDVVTLALYGCGIYVTYLLVLKDSHVDSGAADKVCGLVQKNGCSTVLANGSASLFGLFPWCEIGAAYFIVSFLAMLVGGRVGALWLPWIALCCLPYTVWSVAWQKFKIHAWCTLCLCVQTLFWLIAIAYFISGDYTNPLPFDWAAAALFVSYIGAFMAIHRIVPLLFRYERSSDNQLMD